MMSFVCQSNLVVCMLVRSSDVAVLRLAINGRYG